VVGAGGLGCPAALYLAASGIGKLTIADPDTVDLTNLQRQILYRTDSVGAQKVEAARALCLES
jgi:molybdopterin/thiamine biosynthesis adenylyltransferase